MKCGAYNTTLKNSLSIWARAYLSKATSAALTAFSTSSAELSGTNACASPVAGLKLCK